MKLINKYRSIEEKIAALKAELQSLEGEEDYKKEQEFLNELQKLMAEYGKKEGDVISIITGNNTSPKKKRNKQKTRTVKVYKNPNTGEEIEAKSMNNKIIRQWIESYSKEEVEGWVVKEI